MKNTTQFVGLTSNRTQARVQFKFPESKICPETTRCYSLGELSQAARENEWMVPVLAAAKSAGLR